MKTPRLFTAQITYPKTTSYGDTRACVKLPNCVMVKDKVAQLVKGKVVPLLFLPRTPDQQAFLDAELVKSDGALTRENYEYFMPFMLPLGLTGREYMVLDLEENQKLQAIYEERNRNSRW